MLQIEIIIVGKIKSDWIQSGLDHYAKLLSKFADTHFTPVKEADNASATTEQILAVESERIRKLLAPRAFAVLLDAEGKHYDSVAFSGLISHAKLANSKLQFIIGGAFGISADLKNDIKHHLSLSRMTFPHELTTVVLLEQLYRACSIEAGSKYHK